MPKVVQTVTLHSNENYGHHVPPGPFGEFLEELPRAVRQSIRMAFSGRSVGSGRRPRWLEDAADIRLIDYRGDDDTILSFEAPLLADAAPDLYEQKDLWPTRPEGTDTGFDLLADVIADVFQKNADSERFDRPLLDRLARFERPISTAFQEITISSQRYPITRPCMLNRTVVETAKSFKSNTPPTQPARIVGVLDMIRASTQTFALQLDNGDEIKGVLLEGEIDKLTAVFRKRVLVLGNAVYRTSGRLLRIDATEVIQASKQDKFFATPPKPMRQKLDVREILREQRHKKGLAAVFGKWPGDETDEEIERALREMS